MMRRFVSIASHLLKIKNFASFMGVMSGLNISSVTRLKETVALFEKSYPESQQVACCNAILSSAHSQEFESMMLLEDPTGSFAKLREHMAGAGTQIIPYMYACELSRSLFIR
jgi:hypothetical protein